MKINHRGYEIEIKPRYVQLMAECLLQWQRGDGYDPDEVDQAAQFRDEIMEDFRKLVEAQVVMEKD